MRKSSMLRWLLLVAAAMIALSGCSNAKPPKEALETALTKSADMKSYTFKGSLAIDQLELPQEALKNAPAGMADMIKNASITVDGTAQTDPMQMEMNISIALKGDMAIQLQIPAVMTADKMWFKVPNIPGYNLGAATGKFVELDLKELEEQQGLKGSAADVNTSRDMLQDMYGIAMKHFDEKDYFSQPKASEVKGLPEDLKPDQIVRFAVNPDNVDKTITTIVSKVAPEIIDLLLNNQQYRDVLQLKEADLKSAKEDLTGKDSGELNKQIEAFKKDVKINELSMTSAIKDGYPVYQQAVANVDVNDNGQTGKVGLTASGQYDHINEKVVFKIGIPKDTITLDQFIGSLMGQGL